MHIWTNLVLVVQLVSALAMIGLVLVQHGKGADMGASFGSGASGSLFGATGSANFLSRFTAVCAAVFFLATLGLVFINTSGTARAPSAGGSVLDRGVSASAPAQSAASAVGAIPGMAPLTQGVAASAPAVVPVPAPIALPGSIPTK